MGRRASASTGMHPLALRQRLRLQPLDRGEDTTVLDCGFDSRCLLLLLGRGVIIVM